jgi:hypothetical protein
VRGAALLGRDEAQSRRRRGDGGLGVREHVVDDVTRDVGHRSGAGAMFFRARAGEERQRTDSKCGAQRCWGAAKLKAGVGAETAAWGCGSTSLTTLRETLVIAAAQARCFFEQERGRASAHRQQVRGAALLGRGEAQSRRRRGDGGLGVREHVVDDVGQSHELLIQGTRADKRGCGQCFGARRILATSLLQKV